MVERLDFPLVRIVGPFAAALLVGFWGCEKGREIPTEEMTPMKLIISSSQMTGGQQIPVKYTGDGENISPPLKWSDPPEGTKELALIMDDPDAPRPDPWVHRVVYKIPPDVSGLPEGVAPAGELPDLGGALQGKNSSGGLGYRGPSPPRGHGVHHYHFKLYALSAEIDLPPGADKESLLQSMSGHILAEGEIVVTYQR